MTLENASLPTYYISHGGGPWPWIKDQMPGVYDRLEASLKEMPRELASAPKAILAISGHWEEREFTVMSAARPPMIYDYSGFPEFTFHIQYPAPGAPAVASRAQELLRNAGFEAASDPHRGFDHGVFAPFFVAWPAAEVPIAQLSIRADYDPKAHLAAGRALAPLRQEGILIVGSGLSYHNLREFGPRGADASRRFDAWLTDTICGSAPERRTQKLIDWAQAPAARLSHPREDHLIPLMVAVGAAEQESAGYAYHEEAFAGGLTVSSFRFGKAAHSKS